MNLAFAVLSYECVAPADADVGNSQIVVVSSPDFYQSFRIEVNHMESFVLLVGILTLELDTLQNHVVILGFLYFKDIEEPAIYQDLFFVLTPAELAVERLPIIADHALS